LNALERAVYDVQCGGPTIVDIDEARSRLINYSQKVFTAKMEEIKKAETTFLETNKRKEGVITLQSGLQYKVIIQGTGQKPSYFDKVEAQLVGATQHGEILESTTDGDPPTFSVRGTLPGLQEALQLMPVGSKWKIFIPSDLAYGPRGSSQVGPYTPLVFEVELLSIY
jgi:FKBP-type peptidyl-prolyl cis-trans isomerase FklB